MSEMQPDPTTTESDDLKQAVIAGLGIAVIRFVQLLGKVNVVGVNQDVGVKNFSRYRINA